MIQRKMKRRNLKEIQKMIKRKNQRVMLKRKNLKVMIKKRPKKRILKTKIRKSLQKRIRRKKRKVLELQSLIFLNLILKLLLSKKTMERNKQNK